MTTLARAGISCSMESGRGIIQDQIAIGGPPCLGNAETFADQMLSWNMRSQRTARAQTVPTIFDRGVPDVIAA